MGEMPRMLHGKGKEGKETRAEVRRCCVVVWGFEWFGGGVPRRRGWGLGFGWDVYVYMYACRWMGMCVCMEGGTLGEERRVYREVWM